MRPLAVYIYSFGSQSCATRLALLRSARLRPRPRPRMSPWSRSAARPSSFIGLVVPQPLAAAWPPAPCIRHLRRDTASAGYRLSCLACIWHITRAKRAAKRSLEVCADREPAARLSLLQSASPSKPPAPWMRRVFLRSIFARRRLWPTPLSNPRSVRPLALLADLDRAAFLPRCSRCSRYSRIAPVKARPRIARVSGRSRFFRIRGAPKIATLGV